MFIIKLFKVLNYLENNLSIQDVILMESELAIQWNDEVQSYVHLKLLRDQCPCAFCSGEKDALGNIYKGPKQNLGDVSYKAINMEKVGHYALRIFWGAVIGCVAGLLLLFGGLTALQTASTSIAIPFSVVLIFMMFGLVKSLWESER